MQFTRRSAVIESITRALRGLGALVVAACVPACGGSGTSCSTNGDCAGNDVACVDGSCVHGSTGSSSGSGSHSSSSGGACSDDGQACSSDTDCCDNPNALCESFPGLGSACSATCSADNDCKSGCCGIDSANRRVCAPANFCACSPPGAVCDTTSMCCQSGDGVGALGQVCLIDDGACHACCTSSDGCAAGCCIALATSGCAGACGTPSASDTCL
jgi:hypothetical protein